MAKVKQQPKTIVDLAIDDGSFSTLVDALKAAEMVSTLKENGPFTVFAPDDNAFNRLPKNTLKTLMKPTNRARLQEVLKNHVVEGEQRAVDISSMPSIKTLAGDSLEIEKKGNVTYVGDARIRRTNLEAENGIVHVIDEVLIPEEVD